MGKDGEGGSNDNDGAFTDINKDVPDGLKRKEQGHNPCNKGPLDKRSCTDVICCLIFIIFIIGLAVVGIFAFVNGDPELLIYPEDSNGNLCGQGSYADKKYLFFFDLTKCARMGPGVFVNGCPTPQICVKECPTESFVFKGSFSSENRKFCVENYDKNKDPYEQVADEECPFYYFKSTPVINRCLPLADAVNAVNSIQPPNSTQNYTNGELKEGRDVFDTFLKAKEYGEKIIADVIASWWMILIGLLIAMILSLVWITLMRWIAGVMVWITILAFVAIWGFLTGASWYLYVKYKGTDEELTFYMAMRFTFLKENIFLAGGIIFGVIFLICFILLLFLCSRIRIAISLIKEGSRAVGSMWLSLLWPIIPFLFQIGVIALFLGIATYLASIGRAQNLADNNITFSNGSLDTNAVKEKVRELVGNVNCSTDGTDLASDICEYIKYGKGDFTIYLQIYNLFMLFWLVNFVAAMGQLTLAGAFATYYWAFRKPDDIPSFPVASAFYRCFRYHLGSLAFGSLLIAIVQLIRTLLEYIDHKLKGSENPVAKFFMKCLKCCFWCLEKFLRFITKNAYIMMAVYGRSFCTSGMHAFELILRNVVRVVVIDKVTDFLLFICKLVVVGATGVIAYFFFNGDISYLKDYNPELNFYMVPIVMVIVGAYIIADIFFNVYEMAVDTLFMCFLEDLELNDGSEDKPYFMSKDLMGVLGKKNK